MASQAANMARAESAAATTRTDPATRMSGSCKEYNPRSSDSADAAPSPGVASLRNRRKERR